MLFSDHHNSDHYGDDLNSYQDSGSDRRHSGYTRQSSSSPVGGGFGSQNSFQDSGKRRRYDPLPTTDANVDTDDQQPDKLKWDNVALNEDFMAIADEYKFDPTDLKYYLRDPKHGQWFLDNDVEIEDIQERYIYLKKSQGVAGDSQGVAADEIRYTSQRK
jgi:hypothetical protein